jgi:beta-1,4-mannosyl-glycoprotein beta-1,4-N-acetylglucosaminyltransferase
MAIIDCCPFFNELEILDVRLHELDPVVDKFILVEATQTHSGLPNKPCFEDNKDSFKPFLHKIAHLVVDFPPDLDPKGKPDQGLQPGISWARERWQRDQILQLLKDCRDDDLIIISDADEVARAESILRYAQQDKVYHLDMKSYYYFLNTKVGQWTHAKIIPYGMLKHTQPSIIRNCVTGYPIPHGGWHFSYAGGPERVVKKFQSFAHVEYIHCADINMITRILKEKDFKYEIDNNTPEYVTQNWKKFEDLGFILK